MASGWAVKIGLPKYAELSPDHADAEVQGDAVLQAAYGTLDDALIRHVTRLHDSFCRLARERQAEESRRRRPPSPPPPPPLSLSEPSSPTAALALAPLPPDAAAASCVSCTRIRAPAAAAAAAAAEPPPGDGGGDGDGDGAAAAEAAAAAELEQRLVELAEQQSQVFQRMVAVVSLSARAAEKRHGDEPCLEPRPPAEPRPPPQPPPPPLPQARCTKVSGLIRPMLLRAAAPTDDCVFALQSGTAAAAAAPPTVPRRCRHRRRCSRPLPPKRNKRQVAVRAAAAPTVAAQRRQRRWQGREGKRAKEGGWDEEAHAPLVSIRRSDLNARPSHEAAVRFPVPPQPQQPPPPRPARVRPSTQPVVVPAAAGRFGHRVVSTPLELPRISVTASRRTRRPLPPGSPRPSTEAAATGAAAVVAATEDVFEEPSTRVKRGLAITPMYEPLSFNTLQFFRQGYAVV